MDDGVVWHSILAPNGHVERVRLDTGRAAPDCLDECFARDDVIWMCKQDVQQECLNRGARIRLPQPSLHLASPLLRRPSDSKRAGSSKLTTMVLPAQPFLRTHQNRAANAHACRIDEHPMCAGVQGKHRSGCACPTCCDERCNERINGSTPGAFLHRGHLAW